MKGISCRVCDKSSETVTVIVVMNVNGGDGKKGIGFQDPGSGTGQAPSVGGGLLEGPSSAYRAPWAWGLGVPG